MAWFEIAETSEWTQDRELAESAMEQGLSVCEFDEDSLKARAIRLEEQISKLTQAVQTANSEIYEKLIGIQNSANPIQKNMHAHGIAHDLQILRKAFDI